MFLGVLFASVNVLGGYAGFVFGFILASVPVYIIVHLILYRGFSKLIKTSIPLGTLIVFSCVGVALCCFDAFGYNSYVPKTQDIKSAGFYDANSNYQAKGSAVGKTLKIWLMILQTKTQSQISWRHITNLLTTAIIR